jgi:hypothetical protein
MSNSVHSIQVARAETQTKEAVQPPKTLQTEAATQNKIPQDVVTISHEARQALSRNT